MVEGPLEKVKVYTQSYYWNSVVQWIYTSVCYSHALELLEKY